MSVVRRSSCFFFVLPASMLLVACVAAPQPSPPTHSAAEDRLYQRLKAEGVAVFTDPCAVSAGLGPDQAPAAMQAPQAATMHAAIESFFELQNIPLRKRLTPFYCGSESLGSGSARASATTPAASPTAAAANRSPRTGTPAVALPRRTADLLDGGLRSSTAAPGAVATGLVADAKLTRTDPKLAAAWQQLLRELTTKRACEPGTTAARGCFPAAAAAAFIDIDVPTAARLRAAFGTPLVWVFQGTVVVPTTGTVVAVRTGELLLNVGEVLLLHEVFPKDTRARHSQTTGRSLLIDLDQREVLWQRGPLRSVLKTYEDNDALGGTWLLSMVKNLL